MKKNNFYIGSFLLLALSMGSCKKEFLHPEPDSILTTANFFKTANDLDQATIATYSRYQARKPFDYLIMELPSDNLYLSANAAIAAAFDIDALTVNSENNTVLNFWNNTYNCIFRANSVLVNIDKPTNYKAGQKEQLMGEAKFLRALFYFDLVRIFGGVPKVTKPLTVEESRATPRASQEEIYQFIVSDLQDAITNLPATMPRGRASKSAAVAMLAKVFVYRKDWNNAKTYLDQMEQFSHSLVPNFSSLFKVATEDNAEAIFSLKYTDGTNGHTLSTAFIPNGGAAGIVNRGDEVALPSYSLWKKYEAGDTRKAATVSEDYTPPSGGASIKYPYVSKFAVQHTFGSSGLDIPVIRFADVVLLRAEVYFNLNQPDKALTELNKIRERAFGDATHNYTLADIATEELFYDKLLLERQLEFAYENERWFDLVRTGRFVTVLATEERGFNFSSQTPNVAILNPQPFEKVFPIPYTQIAQANPGVLEQNEGYTR
ncbi:MAG TPA: RagB/SusD family nutrient uptake outer membrane protein [Flavisolibacter sp.]|jgi:hypothetical protein|nr:RagB/SusD family nutrient uptake outer membrane protein [Flavisolibacter sp.]